MPSEKVVETDVLIIGGAIAGCFAAIKAREQGIDVTIVDKSYAGKSGASMGAGGGWAVFNPEWGNDFDVCMHDITTKGEYINHREWSEILLKDSLPVYKDLVSWGAEFADNAAAYARKIQVGAIPSQYIWGVLPPIQRKIPPVLRKQAVKSGVKIIDRITVTDLLKQDGKVVGAIGFSIDSNDLYVFKAKATVLSAGSVAFKSLGHEIFMLTGDAEGMAYRAGAGITGKENLYMVDTYANYPAWRRGRPARYAFNNIVDAEGNKLPQLGTEPHLSSEYLVHIGKGPLFQDFGPATNDDIERIYKRIADTRRPVIEHERVGEDYRRRPKLQMAGGAAVGYAEPRAGIWITNTKCATELPGLYAAGDCCGNMMLGAYYHALGFGVAGAAVTGRRAGGGAAEYAIHADKPTVDEKEIVRLKHALYAPFERKGGFEPRWLTQVLQGITIPYFILHIKHGERLQAALKLVEFLNDHLVPKLTARDAHELRLAHETKNMVLNAEMILRASLFRTESRGPHYREDYPRRDDPSWLAWVILKEEQGRMKCLKEPVPKEWWPDLSKPYKERYPVRFPGE